jgi:hypothetical protein
MEEWRVVEELRKRAAEDLRVREELAAQGVLAEGYHPRMEAVHRENAAFLEALIEERGWPDALRFGAEAAEAAWLIAQHAIGEPERMRRFARELAEVARAGRVPRWHAAMLEDRIRVLEGRPQIYGTQVEADHEGRARPCELLDPENVEARRAEVGLPPLAERLAEMGRLSVPRDPERFAREHAEWIVRTGWRERRSAP